MKARSRNILPKTKSIAGKHNVDLAIPNCEGSGIGNAIVYTRLVEEFALSVGRPIKIMTGPLSPSIGLVDKEDQFAIWKNNPFVASIINAQEHDPSDLETINKERLSLIQLNHVIENICWAYDVKPRELRCSLFLSRNEMIWALNALKNIPRPLICLHPGGNTKSVNGSPWYEKNWAEIINYFKGKAGFVQVGSVTLGDYNLDLVNPGKYLRDMMAIIWAADIFIGFDSCPMHVATAFRKPVVSLFDMRRKLEAESKYNALMIPSVMLRWSYPINRNIAIMENDIQNHSLSLVIDEINTQIEKLTYSP